MKIKFFYPYWGSESMSIGSFCEKVKSEGFDGVEMGLPSDKTKKNETMNIQVSGSKTLVNYRGKEFRNEGRTK